MWWFPEKPTPARKATAFTLIEVILATALAATVMVAALSVLTRFGRWRSGRVGGEGPRAVADATARVIESDLLAGRTVRLGADGIAIDGFGWIDPATGAATQRAARVVYRVARTAGRSWLIRRQTAPDEAGTARTSGELLCRGVERIELAAPVALGEQPAGQPRRVGPDGFVPMPATLKLTLVLESDPGAPARTIERIINLR